MKAQIAVEYLIVVSFALMILIPYTLYLMSVSQNFSDDNSLTVASDSVNKIGETADWVYSQGEPSKSQILVTIPNHLVSATFINRTMIWKVKTSSGISDIYYTSVASLSGSFPTAPGYYNLLIQATSNGVNISVSAS
jgi:uncharacterized protein (UPF0333 family)